MKKAKKIELYKVEDFDCLYLDEKGTPYIVKPKAIRYAGQNMQEKSLFFCKSGWQSKNNTSVHLKTLIAKTLLGVEGKHIWYKDNDPNNCTPDNLLFLEKGHYAPREYTEENSFVCKECGETFFRLRDNYKDKICSSCKHQLEVLEKTKEKENKFKSIYKYLIKHKGMYRQTELRDKIFERLKDGKTYSQIAREIGVSRQCVHISIQTAFDVIERKQKETGE